jgi:ubiquinone/menaquinone biosynthesis C-methylase UbiE
VTVTESSIPSAVQAFDALAPRFDERFDGWLSVAAQRRAVRRNLLHAFAEGSRVLELGGGTGGDALFLAERGRSVLLTDGSPTMLECAAEKVRAAGVAHRVETRQLVLEDMEEFATLYEGEVGERFDGAFSNFAALNCVQDLRGVARGLARLLRPEARVLIVVFGPLSIGEIVVQLARGDVRSAFRRFAKSEVRARVGAHDFVVRYPSPGSVARAFAPFFRLVRVRGIGVFVPPSAAEPAISSMPRLLRMLEALDRAVSAPLALFGDHVLIELERTAR